MNIYPDLQTTQKYFEEYNIVPVYTELYSDTETPISVFKKLQTQNYCFLFESVESSEKWGRYSFIGRNPFLVINSTTVEGNIVEAVKEHINSYKIPEIEELPRFYGGAVGHFGYDTIRSYENIGDIPPDNVGAPESHFMFVNELIVFDRLKQKIIVIVLLHKNDEKSYNEAVERIHFIREELKSPLKNDETAKNTDKFEIKSSSTREKFCENVNILKNHIENGDIFQAVLSQQFNVDFSGDPLNVYRALRVINPSAYMYYQKFDDYAIAGSSPEMLVRVENGLIETCPIAGTRKRGSTAQEDDLLAQDLLSDEKEVAEHTMLVDLARNDVGRVAEFKSVKVKNFMHVERYSHVMHIVTNVEGTLRKDKTPFDALVSILPAGTLSGAPKVRAMQLINKLENQKRGIYGGAVGYIGFNSTIDSCITIRTIIFKNGKAYVQSGAGIVADSVPELEYEETVNKAKALMKALEFSKEIP